MTDRIREIANVYAKGDEVEQLIEELEKLVMDEREACAKIVQSMAVVPVRSLREELAAVIRARKP